jgi:hypothetical protein
MSNIFTDLFSTQPAQDAANAKIAGYTNGNNTAQTALTAGQTSADQLYGQAYQPFASLMDTTGAGAKSYADATGVNGQAGIDAAGSTFKSLPGYSGGLTTGIDQVMRTNAAAGNLGGGNNTADEIKFASDYDAGKYGNYVSSLAPYLGANQNAVAGGASVLGANAAADLGAAGQKAQYGYNAATGTGNANADAALAPYSASQNFWGALTGLGSLGLKASGVGGFAPSAGSVANYGQTANASGLGAGTGGISFPMFS